MYNATFREKPKRTSEPTQSREGENEMTKFEEELSSLPVSIHYAEYWNKTQLLKVFKDWQPQQALPVVPEEVAEFITKVKKAGNNLTFAFNSKFDECPAKYWNEAIVWRLNHPEEFALAFITGNYQIEKPKLFYLRNKLTGMYLYKKPLCGYGEDSANYIKDLTNDFKFTQKEIDGMDIQSYDKKDEYKGE